MSLLLPAAIRLALTILLYRWLAPTLPLSFVAVLSLHFILIDLTADLRKAGR